MIYGARKVKNDDNLTLEKMLTYGLEDEYLAREEYDIALKTLGENEKPFNGIISSEDVHIKWLKELLTKYGYPIPEDESKKYIQAPKDIIEAANHGIQAEIDNIEMYDKFLLEDIPEDVKIIFTKLRDASKGHLFVLRKRLDELK